MDCPNTRSRIQEALDGDPLPAAAEDHLAHCPACAEFAARVRALDASLSADPEMAFPADSVREIFSRIHRHRTRGRWLSAAAAILVAASLWMGANLAGASPAGRTIAHRLGIPHSPGAALAGWREGIQSLLTEGTGVVAKLPLSPGIAVGLAALLLLILVNGAVIARPLLARRRSS